MRVNQKKTQLLCVSANTTSNVTSYIKTGNTKICSTDELKILGFKFGSSPSVKPHVDYMISKAQKRLWTIRHAKKSGMSENDLLKLFNSVIRPVLEYAAPVFHPMLNLGMRDSIERIQKRACKIIYGWNSDYDKLIDAGKIVTLEKRREKLTIDFALKCKNSARFGGWFEEKERTNLRKSLSINEEFAKTERLKNSRLFYMLSLIHI